MSEQPVFPRKVLFGWITAAVLAFACSLYFMGRGDEKASEVASGPSVFSRSAIGYAGIADILEKLGETIVKRRNAARGKPEHGTLTIIAEPRFGFEARAARRTLRDGEIVLLILPKWHGAASTEHRGWIQGATLVSEFETAWALALGVDDGKIVRPSTVAPWRDNALGLEPDIVEPVQLVKSTHLTPIVANEDGILVGEMRGQKRRLWILADPDVMANHGIGRKGNAAFSVALIRALRGEGGAIVFDDTVHGVVVNTEASRPPLNPFKLPFDKRFLPATLQGGLAVVLLLWAAVARFGVPVPAPPPLDAGKRGLIQNAARLIAFAGYQRVIAKRYVEETIREVARQIHAPRGLADEGLVDWLGRVGQARGIEGNCGGIYREARALDQARGSDASPLMAMVRDIYRWKQEMIDGASRNPHDRRGDSQRGPQGGRRPG